MYIRKQLGPALFALSLLAHFPALAAAEAENVQYFDAGDGLPFSEAVRVGDMLYLSGQIGVAPGTTTLVPGGMEAEARQTMENIRGILERRGLDFDAVVKCTVMLSDINDWPAFNKVYVDYFKAGSLPARSAFAAAGLAFGGKLEVECWAQYTTKTSPQR